MPSLKFSRPTFIAAIFSRRPASQTSQPQAKRRDQWVADLQAWVENAPHGEQRELARINILRSFEKKTVELHLSDLRLSSLPDCIGELTHLKRLDVSRNALSDLPESIGRLHNLEFLNVSRNQLRDLPPELSHLTQLEKLRLKGNQLRTLPRFLGKIERLAHLDARNNEISYLSRGLSSLTELRVLRLDENRLTRLPDIFKNLWDLEQLTFEENPIRHLPPSLVNIPDGSEIVSTHLNKLFYSAQPGAKAAEEVRANRRIIEELTAWADLDSANNSLSLKIQKNSANFLLGKLLAKMEADYPPPDDGTEKGSVLRLSRALEQALSFRSEIKPGWISTVARELLASDEQDRKYFNIDGVMTSRADIADLATADSALLPNLHQQEDDALEENQREIQAGEVADVHMTGFVLRGARLLDELKRRTQGSGPSTRAAHQELDLRRFTRTLVKTAAARGESPETQAMLEVGGKHLWGRHTPIDELGLRTTVLEALNVMWNYINTHPDKHVKYNLTSALIQRIKDIGIERPCNTGCVQRILQTTEGIDLSLTYGEPDDTELRREMLGVAGEINNALEEEYLFDYHGDEPDEAEINKLKEDIIRATIESRFVNFRGISQETVTRVSKPVLEMVRHL